MTNVPADEHYALCQVLDRVLVHIAGNVDMNRDVMKLLLMSVHNIPGYLQFGNREFAIQIQHDFDIFDDHFAKGEAAICLRETYREALAEYNRRK